MEMSEEKTKPTNAELDTWMAGVMGWRIYQYVFTDKPDEYYIEDKINGREFVGMPVKDYRPTEILEQAITGAFKELWDIKFTYQMSNGGWYVENENGYRTLILSRYTPHSEIANRIVKTLYEERKRNDK